MAKQYSPTLMGTVHLSTPGAHLAAPAFQSTHYTLLKAHLRSEWPPPAMAMNSASCYPAAVPLRWNRMAPTENTLPSTIKPMLGRLARSAFDSPKHLFELKWDGMAGLAFVAP